ncbi:hypothetical protein ACQ4PT_013838 [Festuca glaucescens]
MQLGHHDVPAVPRCFFLQMRRSDLTALSLPPHIAPVVARQLKVTPHAAMSVPVQNGEFYEYAIHMEWFHGALYFMRGWMEYSKKMKLGEKDIIVFKLVSDGFTMTLIPDDLAIENEYELDVFDINDKPKEWALPLEMSEINWVLVKEQKFYYDLLKDEDFFELDQFFVHRMTEDDLNFLVMDCEVFKPGSHCPHVPGEGVTYTVIEHDDDEGNMNEVFTETELSQEILVNEIRKFVQKSVERRELRRSIRKQGRKDKRRLLLKDGDADAIDVCPRATSRYCMSYFLEVIKNVRNCPRKTKLVNDIGFGDILQLDDCIVPRAFAQWLADFAMSDDVPDDVFKRCFMVVNLGSFLCPTSSTKPSTKYLGALVDVDNI